MVGLLTELLPLLSCQDDCNSEHGTDSARGSENYPAIVHLLTSTICAFHRATVPVFPNEGDTSDGSAVFTDLCIDQDYARVFECINPPELKRPLGDSGNNPGIILQGDSPEYREVRMQQV